MAAGPFRFALRRGASNILIVGGMQRSAPAIAREPAAAYHTELSVAAWDSPQREKDTMKKPLFRRYEREWEQQAGAQT